MMSVAMFLLIAAAQSHHGGPQPMTCPVGGERFEAWQAGSFSTFGERPDGRPYSYRSFPFPLPQCPTNKLVMFDEFTADERPRLATLIEDPGYAEALAAEPYAAAAWLATRLDRPAAQAAWLLLTATWSVTPDRLNGTPTTAAVTLATRLQRAFADRVAALPSDTPAADRLALEARAANALRQIGSFEEAEAARVRATSHLAPGAEDGWQTYLSMLEVAITRRDTSSEPLDMIPQQVASSICEEQSFPDRSFEAQFCASPRAKSPSD